MPKNNGGQPANPPTLSNEITKKVLRDIVDGRYLPGSRLPTERMLAKNFNVARQVVRESLKHLEALGVITIRQRSGITVNDLPISCFFEHFELFLFEADGTLNIDCLKDILKFRRDVFIAVTRDAAKYHTQADLEELKSIQQEFKEAPDDPDRKLEMLIRYMRTFSRATHSRIYQMIANTGIRVVLKVYFLLIPTSMVTPESVEIMERILEAVENRDHEIAAILTAREMEKTDDMIFKSLEDRQEDLYTDSLN
ncbi:MAG: FadR family transcriptional regulator [Proteobacteria bacterium]|nr:FadR family transcriptional regulator [Pseudomonadota bacterium]